MHRKEAKHGILCKAESVKGGDRDVHTQSINIIFNP